MKQAPEHESKLQQLIVQGDKSYDEYNYEHAISHYSEALNLLHSYKIPIDAFRLIQVYKKRGLAFYNTKQFSEAINDFNAAIKLYPNWDEAFYNRGVCYCDIGEYESAIEDFNKSIEINPNDALAYNERGLAFTQIGKLDKAISDFSKALEIDPNYEPAASNLQKARGLNIL